LGLIAVPTLLLSGALAPAVAAEPAAPISLNIADGANVPYGSPLTISATDAAGAAVVFQASGACFVTNMAQRAGEPSRALVMATTTLDTCTITAVSGEGASANRETITLRTVPGDQRAMFKRGGGNLKSESTLMLAPRDQRTMQGQSLSFRVQRGKASCSVLRVKQHWMIRTNQPGACVIRATAKGVNGRYLPFAQVLTFQVR
jgi:hypothetical protein